MADPADRITSTLRQRQAAVPDHPLNTIPNDIKPNGRIPNTPLAASTISFLLGSLFSLGVLTFAAAAWSAFHWGEFAVTAGWNLEKCSVDSFLLDNGSMYHIAHGTALVEYFITLYFKPSWKSYPYVTTVGIVLILVGQVLRSTAMIHATTNFSHMIAFKKQDSHVLVTDGVYAWFRHPSYAGFFYWALGTQLVLQNRISFVGFVVVLWRFFYFRTRAEERALVRFFGDEYVEYRRSVGTNIPFIP
ncbi:Isoprenylcysteine carboxyl methyltransferase family-domain-containing protein [Armillaria novae-zelandiae]|uniref:Protein-S-isoprenylcysteine O-methyltransferase n=1 Tax=Armillaria novae-zelandiae TaxID=153914 RepID=A0AA39PUX2_9AGAR|nr:Isoprenylcysteine carboxyl methyltransferase family-domain-containing protein [Armillaria novae-zelandiae]